VAEKRKTKFGECTEKVLFTLSHETVLHLIVDKTTKRHTNTRKDWGEKKKNDVAASADATGRTIVDINDSGKKQNKNKPD
jgi:hypothetical protein